MRRPDLQVPSVPESGEAGTRSDDPSALNDSNQYYNDSDHQEEMDKTSHGVRRNQAEQPEDNQEDNNCFEHSEHPLIQRYFCLKPADFTLRRSWRLSEIQEAYRQAAIDKNGEIPVNQVVEEPK